jgi:uncharacterized protein
MSNLKQFEKQQYLNLETFRKDGQGVKTPVWFAQEGDLLYVWTEATSGKAKRIRRSANIKIVPSKGDGTPVGAWVAASARELPDAPTLKKVDAMFIKKYGIQKHLFGLLGRLRKAQYTVIEVQMSNN